MRIAILLLLVACADRPFGVPGDDDPTPTPSCEAAAPGQTSFGTGVDLAHAAWNGDGYAITWYAVESGGAFFARTDASGTLIPNSTRSISPTGLFPRVAFDGTSYSVVFAEPRGAGRALVLARFDQFGAPLAAQSTLAIGSDALQNPLVVWNRAAKQWGVLYEDLGAEARVVFTRLAQAGTPVGASLALGAHGAQFGGSGNSLLATTDGYVIAWTQTEPPSVQLANLDANGVLREQTKVSDGKQPYRPALAAHADELAIAWMDARDQTFEVTFTVLGGTPITWHAPNTHFGEPNIIWDGTGYLVVGDRQIGNASDVWLDRVRPDGTRTGVSIVGTDAIFPYLLSSGCQPAITFVDFGRGTNGRLVVLDSFD